MLLNIYTLPFSGTVRIFDCSTKKVILEYIDSPGDLPVDILRLPLLRIYTANDIIYIDTDTAMTTEEACAVFEH